MILKIEVPEGTELISITAIGNFVDDYTRQVTTNVQAGLIRIKEDDERVYKIGEVSNE